MEWLGERTSHGYGVLNKVGAHRIAYLIWYGIDPGSLHVLHSCDNPPCVRGDHLSLGTHADNMADMSVRGRVGKTHKVSDEQVQEIRARYAAGEFVEAIAPDYGINRRHVARLVKGETRGLPPVQVAWPTSGTSLRRRSFTDDQEDAIEADYAAGGVSQTKLAVKYGTSQITISEAVRRVRRRRAESSERMPTD